MVCGGRIRGGFLCPALRDGGAYALAEMTREDWSCGTPTRKCDGLFSPFPLARNGFETPAVPKAFGGPLLIGRIQPKRYGVFLPGSCSCRCNPPLLLIILPA